VADALEQIEDERADVTNNANAAREAYSARLRDITNAERNLSTKKQDLSLLELEKQQVTSDYQEAIKAKTQIECIVRDLQEASNSSDQSRRSLEKQLESIETSISKKNTELAKIIPKWETATERERTLKIDIEDSSTRMNTLYAKQGRSNQFSTQRERDTYLNGEIEKLKILIPAAQNRLDDTQSEVLRAKEAYKEAGEKAKNVVSALDGRKEALKALAEEVQELNAKKHELVEQRKLVTFLFNM